MRGFNASALLLLWLAPAAAGAAGDADRAAITARLLEWTEAFNARDASKSCDLFSADLISTMRGRPDEGRDAVCQRIATALTDQNVSLRYAARIEEIILSGDLAVVRLVWSVATRRGAKVASWEEPGLDVFRREADGKWRIFRFLAFSTARGLKYPRRADIAWVELSPRRLIYSSVMSKEHYRRPHCAAASMHKGTSVMAVKTNFSAEEWNTLLGGPVLAGFAITAAEPSGIFGTLAEGWANAKELAAAKTSASDELIKSVAEDLFTSEGRTSARDRVAALLKDAKPEELKDRALGELQRIVGLVDAKAPADASAFKHWLSHIAQIVAEAASEGGFLGFGGVQVSEKEKATLAQINGVLGV